MYIYFPKIFINPVGLPCPNIHVFFNDDCRRSFIVFASSAHRFYPSDLCSINGHFCTTETATECYLQAIQVPREQCLRWLLKNAYNITDSRAYTTSRFRVMCMRYTAVYLYIPTIYYQYKYMISCNRYFIYEVLGIKYAGKRAKSIQNQYRLKCFIYIFFNLYNPSILNIAVYYIYVYGVSFKSLEFRYFRFLVILLYILADISTMYHAYLRTVQFHNL